MTDSDRNVERRERTAEFPPFDVNKKFNTTVPKDYALYDIQASHSSILGIGQTEKNIDKAVNIIF